MSLYILGINHRTAPVEIREQVVFEPDRLPEALKRIVDMGNVAESVIVSTCNRTELYLDLENSARPKVQSWLEKYHNLGSGIQECLYTLDSHDAVTHTFNVACGLDSMILGEPQILGQMKDAYRLAMEANTVGPMLNRLFQHAFSVAKQVRTDTKIGESAVSVAYAAVSLARRIFAGFKDHTALLVGAGETIELAARHLHASELKRMVVANRTLRRARTLASHYDAYAITLDEIPAHLRDADIVISSTASPFPVVRHDWVVEALQARRGRPMFLLDIAVPRDIEASVAELPNVYLYTVDDLHEVVTENLQSREHAAQHATDIIRTEVERFDLSLKTLDAVPTIKGMRADADRLKQETTDQALKMLAAGKDPAEVVDFLAHTLTKKILHMPSQRLREAGEDGKVDLIRTAKDLFGLDDD